MLGEPVTIAVTLIEAPGRGWVAHAAEVRAVAQGATQEEAIAIERLKLRRPVTPKIGPEVPEQIDQLAVLEFGK